LNEVQEENGSERERLMEKYTEVKKKLQDV